MKKDFLEVRIGVSNIRMNLSSHVTTFLAEVVAISHMRSNRGTDEMSKEENLYHDYH